MKTYHVVQNNHKAKTGGVKLNILISLVILNFQIIFFMFGNTVRLSAQDTLICDNGGFEDGFDYYFGEVTSFQTGSDNCTPSLGVNPQLGFLLVYPVSTGLVLYPAEPIHWSVFQ
ncbi:MAG: hypothetical protein IPN15_06490 [Saprospiraceae bacterium]|nr:hypothetical protein [Candidatus Vicinibacter affinis]